jgi:hypothetical protein
MQRWATALATLLLLCVHLRAQDLSEIRKRIQERVEEPDYTFTRGLFGNIYSGVTVGGYGNLQNDLRNRRLLGTDTTTVRMNGQGSVIGGQIGVLFKNKFIVTLNATRQSFAENTSFRGSARVTNVAFGATFGYTVYNKNQWLAYPYVGAHFGQGSLNIQNWNTDTIFYGGVGIPRSQTGSYKSRSTLFELGVAMRYSMDQHGGLMLGAEVGGYLAPGATYTNPGQDAQPTGTAPFALQGVYLRFTLGGGLFYTGEYVKRRRRGELQPTEGGIELKNELYEERLDKPARKKDGPDYSDTADEKPADAKPGKPAKAKQQRAPREKVQEVSPFRDKGPKYKAPKPVKPKKKKSDYGDEEFEKD